MRIKVLACAAALAAGALTSMAQSNVYSLNVVGYINLPLTEGFNLVANQLDADGYGTNNTTISVFGANLPVGSAVYTWDPVNTVYDTAVYSVVKGATNWNHSYSLNPGQGAWVSIPVGAFGGQTQNVTTVGQVLQGNLSNPYVLPAGGFNIVSSQIPIGGGLTTTLGYQPLVGDSAYAWDPVGLKYDTAVYSTVKGVTAWHPTEPQIAVGQGFWMDFMPGASWKTNFTVGP